MAVTSDLRRIHWRAPTTIIIAFIAGLSFAIGHHSFYRQLDTKPVDSDDRMFSQQVNGAIGTAFAFLFRASLVIAITGVYWQIFWGNALRKRHTLTVAQLDSLTGLLGSVLSFFDLRTLSYSPELAVVALLAWMVPFTALLPPATLSVVTVNQPEHRQINVPAINFTGDAMYNDFTLPGSSDIYYEGTKSQLFRSATATAFRSVIPDFAAVAPGVTYRSTFAGPTLECRPVSDTDLHLFRRLMSIPRSACGNNTWNSFYPSYLSWVPEEKSTEPRFEINEGCMVGVKRHVSSMLYPVKALRIAYRVYVPTINASDDRDFPKNFDYNEWSLLECSLQHASYTVDITPSASSRSTIRAWSVEKQEPMFKGSHFPSGDEDQQSFENSVATSLSYVAILECVASLLEGQITDGDPQFLLLDSSSDVSRISLAFTQELLQVTRTRGLIDKDLDRPSLAGTNRSSGTPWPEEAFEATVFNHSLAYGVEQLFQNLTLSLLSTSAFLADTGPLTDVVLDRWLNVYTYNSRNLWISYGVALAFTFLACLLGCTTIYRNGASYSNLFSTVLRTTRRLQEFDSLLTGRDETGADPLPQHLSKARIELGLGRVAASDDSYASHIELSQRPLQVTGEQSEAPTGSCGDTIRRGHDSGSSYTILQESDAPRISETVSERSVMMEWPRDEDWERTGDETSPSPRAADVSGLQGSST